MRNKYGGRCYYCGEYVQPGDGFFEKIKGTKKRLESNPLRMCIGTKKGERT